MMKEFSVFVELNLSHAPERTVKNLNKPNLKKKILQIKINSDAKKIWLQQTYKQMGNSRYLKIISFNLAKGA